MAGTNHLHLLLLVLPFLLQTTLNAASPSPSSTPAPSPSITPRLCYFASPPSPYTSSIPPAPAPSVSTARSTSPPPPPPPPPPTPSPSPPPPPPPERSPPPPPPPALPPQLNNVIDALIGAGDFSIWVNILSMSNPNVLPISATLFIPEDATLNLNANGVPLMVDPFLFPYHMVPQRLTFSDLLLFRRNARLPTLLPGKSISVTDDSATNFSLDGTPITHPDIYKTTSIAVHGVAGVLDYSLYGNGIPPPPPPPPAVFSPPPDDAGMPPFLPIGGMSGSGGSPRASLWCTLVHVAILGLVIEDLVFLLLH
ncbi:hypothetical protein PIB30_000504 [Stylosanthes scabra]|uniref:FAS1 domain-containing protein n=1 Tax=Stylosanthes scabra TaxID=79078 RepID=A0ABU6W1W5_9FABA|nr:hypothetical protein [Stylosanthes scabra]